LVRAAVSAAAQQFNSSSINNQRYVCRLLSNPTLAMTPRFPCYLPYDGIHHEYRHRLIGVRLRANIAYFYFYRFLRIERDILPLLPIDLSTD
jgi:hypothetical protein